MQIDRDASGASDDRYVIRAGSRVTASSLEAEPDASSAFALAAVGVARGGVVEIENWPSRSLQPDAVFVDLLREMNCKVGLENGVLRVEGGASLGPLDFDLRDAPDLFPVLAVLCSLANGRSRLYGAPHLAHKESDRIGKIAELIKALGRKVKILPDGLEIEGGQGFPAHFRFSTDHDHRLAMAAAVAQAAGADLEIQEPRVVDKSFPGFWRAIEAGSK
jgi:3-phosphoshikimate 1-carboxyvinyltransferase